MSRNSGEKENRCSQHFWDKVIGQDAVVRALKQSLKTNTLVHAYLFTGAQGLGKINAARAVATQLMCQQAGGHSAQTEAAGNSGSNNGGCGNCHICTRLENNTHPDFAIFEPAGAGGYLVEQIRELNYRAQLAPAEAGYKIFVIRDVDLFNDSAANAFLKTLEEPTASTIFILLSHSQEAVLSTIRSRCQVYRFRPLTPEKARQVLLEKTGVSGQRADTALAANGYIVAAARDYLQSSKQQESRQVALRVFRDLPTADDLDILRMTRDLLRSALDSVDEARAAMDEDFAVRKELLDPVALKQLERYNERRLSALETRQTMMVLNVFSTLLADCLRVTCAGTGADTQNGTINFDVADDIRSLVQNLATTGKPLSPARIASGQDAIARARKRLAQNVKVDLLTQALLFDLREVIS